MLSPGVRAAAHGVTPPLASPSASSGTKRCRRCWRDGSWRSPAHNADGADDTAEAVFLRGEDGLDSRANLRAGGVGPRLRRRQRGPARRRKWTFETKPRLFMCASLAFERYAVPAQTKLKENPINLYRIRRH
jgi:hypothetical protein